MAYQLTTGESVKRLADNAFIPFSPANVDYAAYLAWLDEGNTPLPAPEPEPAPVLTTEQKLEAAGLTVAELRELFGLPAPVEPEPERARNEDGTFVGDDPATPDVNEAWVDGGQS